MLMPRRVLLVTPDMLSWIESRRCGCVEEWLVSLWAKTKLTPCGYILGFMSNHMVMKDYIWLANDLTTWFFPLATSNLRQSHGYTTHIHQHHPYLLMPIHLWFDTAQTLITLSRTVIFGYDSQSLLFFSCFTFSLRLCAPLVYSLADSSPDVSLFISLTVPPAFVLWWFIHSHDTLWFQFAHKSFSHSLSPFVSLSFPNIVDITLLGLSTVESCWPPHCI